MGKSQLGKAEVTMQSAGLHRQRLRDQRWQSFPLPPREVETVFAFVLNGFPRPSLSSFHIAQHLLFSEASEF